MDDSKKLENALKGRMKAFLNAKKALPNSGALHKPPTLIIDVMSLFKTHMYANDTTTQHGLLLGGTVGFLKALPRLVQSFQANKVICVFDGERNADKRKSIYEDYKKGRGNKGASIRYITMTPEEFKQNEHQQMIALVSVLKGLPVEIVVVSDLEADDIIGYLCKQYYKDEDGVRVIVSSDKDFLQLIDENTHLYNIRKKETVTLANIHEYWDAPVANFALIRAIEGDASDNIKGVDKVKLKTLQKLLPEVSSRRFLDVDEFCAYIKENEELLSKSVGGRNLLQSEDIIRRNYRIMQLTNPEISPHSEMLLLGLMKAPKSTSLEFYRVERFIRDNHLSGTIDTGSLKYLFGRLNG